MIVMTLEKVSPALRGALSRWLVELQTGVFVGDVNSSVRDLLWEKALKSNPSGKITQAWKTNTEQGYEFRINGDNDRAIVDFDGFKLIARKNAKAIRKKGPVGITRKKTVSRDTILDT